MLLAREGRTVQYLKCFFQAYQSFGFESATYIPIAVITASTLLFIIMFARERWRGDMKRKDMKSNSV